MKLLLLLLLIISTFIKAEIDYVTLDNWNIRSTSEYDLFVSKNGEKNQSSILAWQLEMPYCVCNNPVITLLSNKTLERGDTIKGTIAVDLKKPKDVIFRVLSYLESGFVFLAPMGFPPFSNSKVVKVNSEIGKETFLTYGISKAMNQSREICQSKYLFENKEPKPDEIDI